MRRDLAGVAEAGFADDALPIPGLRRFIRDGYFYDYRILGRVIEIAAVSSSMNRPLAVTPDDDIDFEVKD